MVQGTDHHRHAHEVAARPSSYEYPGLEPNWTGESHDHNIERIRSRIDRTRAELDHTIDQLQERLSPKLLLHTAFEAMRETAGDQTKRVIDTVRENPAPLALIGAGVIWLLANQTRKKKANPSLDYCEVDFGETEHKELVVRPPIAPAQQPLL